jgi:NADH:ubiquinone oxidoreductase subunit 5 (subunit L)/multisubunit Na+/H+ antiporter MnhA subunit
MSQIGYMIMGVGIGAYSAAIVLATLAVLVLIGMQVYQSGRLRRRQSADHHAASAADPGA